MTFLRKLGLFALVTVLLALPTLSQAQDNDPLGGATVFAKAKSKTAVTVMLDYTPNTNHLGLYVALAKGYFAEANLDVTIQPAGDVQVDQVVALNRAQFGVSYQEQLSYARANGLGVVSVAAIIQHNTSGFAALRNQHPLQSPADLIRLRYGAFGSPLEKPIIEALITCTPNIAIPLDPVTVVDIGFVEPFPLMEADRIDFAWVFRGWDGLRAELAGQELDYLMLSDYPECVPDFYTPILIANETLIAEQPDVVAAFVQATARGYADSINKPAEAAAILLAAEPSLDPALVEASAAYLAEQFMADAEQWGLQKQEVWALFTAFLVEIGELEAPFTVAEAFTNDFLP
jgi:ABC-type nitrate/sulfonate/bicarbonate transport system substrate-binding protein